MRENQTENAVNQAAKRATNAYVNDRWLYVAKRQGKAEFIKAFARFDPAEVQWTSDVTQAAEFTEDEWTREGAVKFILSERLCLVSYADEPRKARERPARGQRVLDDKLDRDVLRERISGE